MKEWCYKFSQSRAFPPMKIKNRMALIFTTVYVSVGQYHCTTIGGWVRTIVHAWVCGQYCLYVRLGGLYPCACGWVGQYLCTRMSEWVNTTFYMGGQEDQHHCRWVGTKIGTHHADTKVYCEHTMRFGWHRDMALCWNQTTTHAFFYGSNGKWSSCRQRYQHFRRSITSIFMRVDSMPMHLQTIMQQINGRLNLFLVLYQNFSWT